MTFILRAWRVTELCISDNLTSNVVPSGSSTLTIGAGMGQTECAPKTSKNKLFPLLPDSAFQYTKAFYVWASPELVKTLENLPALHIAPENPVLEGVRVGPTITCPIGMVIMMDAVLFVSMVNTALSVTGTVAMDRIPASFLPTRIKLYLSCRQGRPSTLWV